MAVPNLVSAQSMGSTPSRQTKRVARAGWSAKPWAPAGMRPVQSETAPAVATPSALPLPGMKTTARATAVWTVRVGKVQGTAGSSAEPCKGQKPMSWSAMPEPLVAETDRMAPG